MSSVNFGAVSPLTERIQKMRDMASGLMNHPISTVKSMLPQAPTPHEQAIQQMNQDMNAHRNDAANASFVHPNLSTMKKPLGK